MLFSHTVLDSIFRVWSRPSFFSQNRKITIYCRTLWICCQLISELLCEWWRRPRAVLGSISRLGHWPIGPGLSGHGALGQLLTRVSGFLSSTCAPGETGSGLSHCCSPVTRHPGSRDSFQGRRGCRFLFWAGNPF